MADLCLFGVKLTVKNQCIFSIYLFILFDKFFSLPLLLKYLSFFFLLFEDSLSLHSLPINSQAECRAICSYTPSCTILYQNSNSAILSVHSKKKTEPIAKLNLGLFHLFLSFSLLASKNPTRVNISKVTRRTGEKTMVVLSKQAIEQFSYMRNSKPAALFPQLPLVDLSKPDCKHQIIKACEEFGFFKVINHGVPMDFISRLESEATKFFSLPLCEKEKTGQPQPFGHGYGNKRIGPNGDVGWVEYLLLTTNQDPNLLRFLSGENPESFRFALNNYMSAVKKMACEILEMIADGLKVQPRNVFSKLLMDEQSDSVFRLNHYPPCPDVQPLNGSNVIGFGEHTDPQIISVLRSNNTSGLQISLRDGSWISVPPDQYSFFVNVGDSLQVMTNGRFKSVKHRVLANSAKSRLSMIYFGGPPLSEKIAPLPSLMGGDQQSLYKEFTWFEYKKSAYNSRLADNRLMHFERIAAS